MHNSTMPGRSTVISADTDKNAAGAAAAGDTTSDTSRTDLASGSVLIEVNDFAVAETYLAVSLRVNCSSTVWVFDLTKVSLGATTSAALLGVVAAAGGAVASEGTTGQSTSSTTSSSSSSREKEPISEPNSSSNFGSTAALNRPDWVIPFDDPTLVVTLEGITDAGPVTQHPILLLHQSSLVTPVTTVLCNLVTHETRVAHVEAVLGGFQQERYSSSLEWAVSRDGVKVPVTVAWRSDLMKKDGSNPALLKG